ncbi:MAG: hypothetical protein QF681_12875 [Vicinamibacterales bacterium]|jgi:hypothetical protein|nr:hypothetical protein [Vicinamibacterales bacterium]
MTQRIRDVVVGGSGRFVLWLCTGVLVSLNPGAAFAQSVAGSADLTHVPSNASIVAYADVREAMFSDVWARIRQIAGDDLGQIRVEQLGLDLEQDIDDVLAFLVPAATPGRPAGLALLRGRFDMTRLEVVAREAGATVSDYAGTRVVSIEADDVGALAMAALEPGLVAVGDLATVHQAVDRQSDGSDVTANEEMMALLDRVEGGSHLWAVGRFGDLSALGILPDDASLQVPAVTAFALSGRIDSGVSGTVSIEGRDEETGQQLRDLLRGVLAIAQSQTAGQAELQTVVDSVELGGIGTTATVSFSLPSETLDLVFSAAAP